TTRPALSRVSLVAMMAVCCGRNQLSMAFGRKTRGSRFKGERRGKIANRNQKFTELGVGVIDRLRAMPAACRYGIQIARFRKPCHCPPTVGGILRLEP